MALNDDLVLLMTKKVTRDLDLGEYSESFRGSVAQIVVNAPTILEQLSDNAVGLPDGDSRKDRSRRMVVALLLDQPLERVAQLDDLLVSWLFAKGLALYNKYHDELLKKAPGG